MTHGSLLAWDKPNSPIPVTSLPTEGLLLGQRFSLPGAAGKKATAGNSTFTLSFQAQRDEG